MKKTVSTERYRVLAEAKNALEDELMGKVILTKEQAKAIVDYYLKPSQNVFIDGAISSIVEQLEWFGKTCACHEGVCDLEKED